MQWAAVQSSALRILKAESVLGILNRFRMPKYSALIELLADYDVYSTACALWRGLFPDKALPGEDIWMVEEELLRMISEVYFSMDDYNAELMYNTEEHPLTFTIMYESWGVGWEASGWIEVEEPVKPLAAVVACFLDMHCDPGWSEETVQDCIADAVTWLRERGYLPLSPYLWGDDEVREKLAGLPVPFDGLAVALDCIFRNRGNRFLDVPSIFFRMEYAQEELDWTVENVRLLGEEYHQVEGDIEKLCAYLDWYNVCARMGEGNQADREVLQLLANVFELEIVEGLDGDELPERSGQVRAPDVERVVNFGNQTLLDVFEREGLLFEMEEDDDDDDGDWGL